MNALLWCYGRRADCKKARYVTLLGVRADKWRTYIPMWPSLGTALCIVCLHTSHVCLLSVAESAVGMVKGRCTADCIYTTYSLLSIRTVIVSDTS